MLTSSRGPTPLTSFKRREETVAETTAAPSMPASAPAVSAGYRRYAMGLLLVIYILNFLDRQVINILAEPIKNELGLLDWQIGAMSGFAFAIFYTLLAVPIARLAEHGHRPYIISAALAI